MEISKNFRMSWPLKYSREENRQVLSTKALVKATESITVEFIH